MAEKVDIKNEQGVVRMSTQKYEGIIWPPMIQDPVKRVEDTLNFPYKDGDLFVCSYPRTGSNWMLDMLSMLRSNTTDVNVVMTPPVEVFPDASVARPQPRTLLTHMPFRLMPKSHAKNGGKMILLHRSPKDTLVSTYYFAKKGQTAYQGDFEEFLQYFISGNIMFSGYIQYLRDWDDTLKKNPDLPVIIVKYEDMKKDCVAQLRRLCSFLELDRTETFLQEVADKNNIDKVKAAKEANPALQQFIKSTSTDGTLHFYRKGILDEWKSHFTVAQTEQFDKLFYEQLKDTVFGYEPYYAPGILDEWKSHFTVAQTEQFDKLFYEQLKDTVFGYEPYCAPGYSIRL